MYEKILVPIDGSETSTKAAFQAVDLAKELNSKVILVTILDQKLAIPYDELEDKGKADIKVITDYANEKEINIESMLLFGSPKNDILITTRRSNPDLIIMGTHGNTGIKSSVLGSFAQFCLKNIDLPILLIK